jgi:hypothetical protein
MIVCSIRFSPTSALAAGLAALVQEDLGEQRPGVAEARLEVFACRARHRLHERIQEVAVGDPK